MQLCLSVTLIFLIIFLLIASSSRVHSISFDPLSSFNHHDHDPQHERE